MAAARTAEHGSRVSARWRIVAWIVLTTAISLLAVMVTLRSVLLGQVANQANHGIVQEVDEFSTFASEGVDPTTARPFSSATAMMERYLARQTPATGEVLIAATATNVFFSDNAANDAGEILAGDQERLHAILTDPEDAGIKDTPHGELRWGRTTARINGQSGTLIVGIFTETAREEVDRDTLLLAGVAAGGLLLTAAMAWLAAGQILRPIRDISQVAGKVDALDLSARVPVEGRDDISQLATTFNEMLDRVERAHVSQRHFVREVQYHLTEPRAEVERHLRTLSDPSVGEAERARAVSGARHALEVMASTLAELELLSQAERPDFLNPRRVNVRDLARDVYELGTVRGPDRQWTLAGARSGTVILDPDRVANAMTQLVRNAYEHTSAGDVIQIGSEVVHDGPDSLARLWVSNHGPSLSQDEARDFLERYRSSPDSNGNGEESGMGLGLAVVRAVADAHGGSAWVESSDDEGTRFGLDIPSAPADPVDLRAAHVEQLTTALRQEG